MYDIIKCELAKCKNPIKYKAINKGRNGQFNTFYCKDHVSEAKDLEGLGFEVHVIDL